MGLAILAGHRRAGGRHEGVQEGLCGWEFSGHRLCLYDFVFQRSLRKLLGTLIWCAALYKVPVVPQEHQGTCSQELTV